MFYLIHFKITFIHFFVIKRFIYNIKLYKKKSDKLCKKIKINIKNNNYRGGGY